MSIYDYSCVLRQSESIYSYSKNDNEVIGDCFSDEYAWRRACTASLALILTTLPCNNNDTKLYQEQFCIFHALMGMVGCGLSLIFTNQTYINHLKIPHPKKALQ